MSDRSYVVMGPVGPLRQLFAAAKTAQRRAGSNDVLRVVVEHADLPPLEGDEYQHAEARMVHWTQQVQRLRPGREPPSVEWRELNSADADELRRVFKAWRDIRREEAKTSGRLDVETWRRLITERLEEVLDRVVEKLGSEPQ